VQFRLRSLLLLVFLAACGLGWWQYEERRLAGIGPVDWDCATGRNIKWSVPLGSCCYAGPVVSGDKVFVATNNAQGYLPRLPSNIDLGVLLCFRSDNGKFLWQASHAKLPTGRAHDWPLQGISSRPLVEGDRLWYVSNRCEVVCLDAQGFHDNQNDGLVQSEPAGQHEADVVWMLDMFGQLGVRPHNASPCAPAADDQRLFVVTGNGVNETHRQIESPQAPSFIALDKRTGKILWSDNSPGANIMHGQWGSPLYAVLGGVPQVLFPGGDGWVYSFDPAGTPQGKAKLLWKFDINPKMSIFTLGGRGTRNEQSFSITVSGGRVYLTTGQDPEHGEGPGHIWCIDPTRRGDISAELVFNPADPKTPVPPRRTAAVDSAAGDYVVPNPNSGALWHYEALDRSGNGTLEFEETMHRSLGGVAIKDGTLIAVDFSGIVHCLNAETGQLVWTHDLLAACWCAPLIAGEHAYVCDEDGDVSIYRLPTGSGNPLVAGRPIAEIPMPNSIYSRPVVVNRTLFIATRDRLYAIGPK
jgi:outer membrane protein assembly factor BamB